MANKNGKTQQRWKIVYVEDYEDEPKKGEMNSKFGLYVERDFHIVSAMGNNKYLDLDLGNRWAVIKTPNGRRQQVWYYDQRTRTIRSRYNNKALDIYNSGRNKELQGYSNPADVWWQKFKFEGGSIVNFRNGKAF